MSQEEEKLIEEFWEDYRNFSELSAHFEEYSREVVCYSFKDRINKSLIKAFRSGKLAGFEMCEKIVKKIDGEVNFEASDKNLIYSESIHRANSLIEEEKKKL